MKSVLGLVAAMPIWGAGDPTSAAWQEHEARRHRQDEEAAAERDRQLRVAADRKRAAEEKRARKAAKRLAQGKNPR